MNTFHHFDGRHLRDGETIYRVLGRVSGKPAVRLDRDGAVTEITLEEFHHQISLGNVTEGQEPVFNDRVMTVEEASEAEFRKFLLQRVNRLRELGVIWDRIRETLSEDLKNEPRFAARAAKVPAVRTIQNYLKEYEAKGNLALCDKRSQSGNRTIRYDELFRETVLDLLEESYLTSDRMTVTALVKQAKIRYLREITKLDPHSKPGPCDRKAVESVIDRHIPHSDVVKRRKGTRLARKETLQAARFQKVEHAYDRIEIDSTQADIWVIYDGNLIRPWITMAVDAATGFIVGLRVSLDHPTASTTIAVLYQAMAEDDDAFFDRYGIKNRVRVAGYPLTVVADQGSENSGPAIDHLLSITTIELQKNIPGHPEKKPFVERAVRTLNDFATQLEGASKTRQISSKDRHDIAKAEACWTFDEFEQKLQIWRYDVYGCLPRRRVQSPLQRRESPIESWRRLSDEAYVPEPPSKQRLAQIFYSIAKTRVVHKYGIEIDYIQYSSQKLRDLEQNTPGQLKVEVRVNPASIRDILVVHPTSGQTIFVPCKDPDLPDISTDELARIIALNRRDSDEALSAHEVMAALIAGKHHKPSKATTKGVKERHAAQRKRRDDVIAQQSSGAGSAIDSDDSHRPAIPVIAPTARNRINARGR